MAADATYAAVLDDQGPLVCIGTAHIHAAVFLATWTDLDDASWTSLGAYAATYALIGINDGKSCLFVDVKGAKIAFLNAIAQSHTTFGTTALASIKSAGKCANVGTFIMDLGRGVLAAAVTAHHSDLGFEGGSGKSEDSGHLAHVGARAGQTVDVAFLGGLLHTGLGQGAAARKATAAAVGAGQTSLRLVDERVLLHLELLRHKVQNHGQYGSENSEYNQ